MSLIYGTFIQPQEQVVKGDNAVDCHGQDHNKVTHQSHVFFDWQPQVMFRSGNPDIDHYHYQESKRLISIDTCLS